MSYIPREADATTTTKGLIQLTGDLGGTAASPKLSRINGITIAGTPTSGQILRANSATTASWASSSASSVPAGGKADQVLSKASAAENDATWSDSVLLSNTATMPITTVASPGTLDAVSRADHQHEVNPAVGYPIRSGMVTNPLGIASSRITLVAGTIVAVPVPVYQPVSIREIVIYVLAEGTNLSMGVYDAAEGSLRPKSLVATLTLSAEWGDRKATPTVPPIYLNAGLYWVTLLPTGGPIDVTGILVADLCNTYTCCESRTPSSKGAYTYGSSYATLPSSLESITPSFNSSPFWYGLRFD